MKHLILLFLSSYSFIVQGQIDWELVNEKKDMKVYVRKIEGSKIKEIKITGQIKCDLSEFVMALQDVERQQAWVESTMDSEMLEKTDDSHFVFYQSTNMPFPVKDRDVVLEYTRSQNSETKTVTIKYKNVDGKYAKKSGFVRVPLSSSIYTINHNSEGYTTFDYYLKVDVGGFIPQWVVNLAMSRSITDTVQALFDYINSGVYKGVVIDGIVD